MKSQTQKVLDHLKQGQPIGNITAFREYHCTRLGSVIERLRGQGHPIKTTLIPHISNGTHTRFAVYTLEES